MKLSEPQQVVAKDKSRFKVLVTGRRFGKTTLAIRELCYVARIPGRVCWYVAPSYRQAKQIAWVKIKKAYTIFIGTLIIKALEKINIMMSTMRGHGTAQC